MKDDLCKQDFLVITALKKWVFPKLQHYWNLAIRLFSVISRTLIGGVLPLCREAVSVFYNPTRLGDNQVETNNH